MDKHGNEGNPMCLYDIPKRFAKLIHIPPQLEDMLARQKRVQELLSQALPMEAEVQEMYKAELAVLEKDATVSYLDKLYPRIDMKFLSQTKYSTKLGAQVPAFAVFQAPDSSVCEIRYDSRTGKLHFEPESLFDSQYWEKMVMTAALSKYFQPSHFARIIKNMNVVADKIDAAANRWGMVGCLCGMVAGALFGTVTGFNAASVPGAVSCGFLLGILGAFLSGILASAMAAMISARMHGVAMDSKVAAIKLSASFAGQIPDSVRKIIRGAETQFDQVYTVTEAPEWEVNVTAKTRLGDPLVIGRKGEVFWLVTTFDTTPVDRYLAEEFTGH